MRVDVATDLLKHLVALSNDRLLYTRSCALARVASKLQEGLPIWLVGRTNMKRGGIRERPQQWLCCQAAVPL